MPNTGDIHQDPTVQAMADDIQVSLQYGDPMSTWFNADGTPQEWFVVACADEYELRTNARVDGYAIAEAIYGLVTE